MNSIETPNQNSKQQSRNPWGGLTACPGGRTGAHETGGRTGNLSGRTGSGGRTGNPSGRTGEEQRANTVLKTAREQDLKSI